MAISEAATFASGCFWCSEAIFKRLKGVLTVESGYSGGKQDNPSHAEAIQITFDPNVIPYEKLLDIFWHTHNPTTLNRQGNDVGTQYRSAIFYHSGDQKEKALASKQELEKEHIYKDLIVTEIVPFVSFHQAEGYHKNYYDRNQDAPYCTYVISPKIQKLLKEFSKEVKEEYKEHAS